MKSDMVGHNYKEFAKHYHKDDNAEDSFMANLDLRQYVNSVQTIANDNIPITDLYLL